MPALPIYTTPAMRKLEELAAPASGTLMERAGAAAAEYARSLCGDTAKSVLVLAGPGNNGGDAFEVATHLKRWFFRVNVVFSGERGKLPKDALMALEKWETAGGTLLHGIPGESRFDLAVDGLFGIGLKRPLSGDYCALEPDAEQADRKSTRLNSSHSSISYAVCCLEKKNKRRRSG